MPEVFPKKTDQFVLVSDNEGLSVLGPRYNAFVLDILIR